MNLYPTPLQLRASNDKLCILDVECNTGGDSKMGPSAFNDHRYKVEKSLELRHSPKLLDIGYIQGSRYAYIDCRDPLCAPGLITIKWDEIDVLVGHNIKFDILWLLTNNYLTREQLYKIHVVDTMLLEYRLTGHSNIFPSLDDTATRYHLEGKLDLVKKFWEAGYDTEDIPVSIIKPYLKQDVVTTGRVLIRQVKDLEDNNMFDMAMLDCVALKAACLLEHTGINIHMNTFDDNRDMLSDKEYELDDKILRIEETCLIDLQSKVRGCSLPSGNTYKNISIDDSLHTEAISKHILYGVDIKLRLRVLINDKEGKPVITKTGNNAGNQKERYEYANLSELRPDLVDTKLLPQAPLSADTIGKITSTPYSSLYLERALVEKELSTYFDGLNDFIIHSKGLSVIHGNINFPATVTGRTSSSKPNLQNISGKDNE